MYSIKKYNLKEKELIAEDNSENEKTYGVSKPLCWLNREIYVIKGIKDDPVFLVHHKKETIKIMVLDCSIEDLTNETDTILDVINKNVKSDSMNFNSLVVFLDNFDFNKKRIKNIYLEYTQLQSLVENNLANLFIISKDCICYLEKNIVNSLVLSKENLILLNGPKIFITKSVDF